MPEIEDGPARGGALSAVGLGGRLGWLYLAGVLGLLTIAYLVFLVLASMMPGRPAPFWQHLIALAFGMIGAFACCWAGKAYVRSCRRSHVQPLVFGLRWLGSPIALASIIALVLLLRAQSRT